MAIPNLKSLVENLSRRFPEEWSLAHTGGPGTEDFIRILAAEAHKVDARFGLNGKRGNPRDVSDDALNALDPVDGPGRTPDGKRCWVVDVIVGAGGPNPQPGWNAFDGLIESSGAWVDPTSGPVPAPVPPPTPSFPYPDENTAGKAFQVRVKQAYTDAGRAFPDPNDQDAFRHFQRFGYSSHEMTAEQAANKHIKELRDQLGVGPER